MILGVVWSGLILQVVVGAFALSASPPVSLRSYATYAEVEIDSTADTSTISIGERLKSGESVLQLENIASEEECNYLCETCSQLNASPTALEKPGLLRLPTIAAARRAAIRNTPCAEPLPVEVDELLQKILVRVAQTIDEQIPSVSDKLFGGASLAQLLVDAELTFSSREPAINIYSSGGEFLAHKDAQALTVLLPLSRPDRDFEGGGTAFWSQDSRGRRVEEPNVVLKPLAGTALLFGGCVTHAGVPVETGTRIVFVASFSSAKSDKPVIEEHRDIYGDSL